MNPVIFIKSENDGKYGAGEVFMIVSNLILAAILALVVGAVVFGLTNHGDLHMPTLSRSATGDLP